MKQKSKRHVQSIERCAKPVRTPDLTGQVFGQWIVDGFYGRKVYSKGKSSQNYWAVVCSCGRGGVVQQSSLKSGTSKRCGVCAHGNPGDWLNPMYNTYHGMLGRCYNPKHADYAYYGGRGIKVCPTWREARTGFRRWLEDVGPKPTPDHSLDRVDNEGPYAPGNTRWATAREQARNRAAWGSRE